MNGVARPRIGLKLTYVKATPLRNALEASPGPPGPEPLVFWVLGPQFPLRECAKRSLHWYDGLATASFENADDI